MNVYFRAGLVLVLGIGLSIAFSVAIEKGLAQYNVHKASRVREIFKSGNYYDAIYIGSSRTHTTIFPSVVDSVTGLLSYNAGMEGGNLFEFKLTLEGYLATHPAPKLAVITIDPGSFDIERKLFFPPQYFDVVDNTEVRKAFEGLDDFKLFFIDHLEFLRLIYYDDYVKSLALRGLAGQNELVNYGHLQDRGFMTNGSSCADTTKQVTVKYQKFTDEGLNKLQSILDTCKNRGIRVLLTYAPEFMFRYQSSFSNFNEIMMKVDSISALNGIKFFRDDSISFCSNPCYFTNYSHLNTSGAIEYSRLLGKRIAEEFGDLREKSLHK